MKNLSVDTRSMNSRIAACLLARCLFTCCLLSLLLAMANQRLAFANEVVGSSKVCEFDMQVGVQQTIRGLCRLRDGQLELALPNPGDRRPESFTLAAANSSILQLQRQTSAKIVDNSLLGTWKVMSSMEGGQPSERFIGDTVVFDDTLMKITETNSKVPYLVPYEVRNKVRLVETQENTVHILRDQYGADVELNERGEVVRLTVTALLEDGSSRNFDQELTTQLAKLTSLEELVLTGFANEMGGASLAFLKDLSQITKLDIRKTGVTDAALVHLSDLPALRVLKLEFNDQLTDAGLAHLEPLIQLEELDLAFVPIHDAGMKSISSLNQLKRLYLYGTQITDQGVAYLRDLQGLEVLYLGSEQGQEVSDASADVLGELRSLQMLGVYGTQMSSQVVQQLRNKLPQCDVLAPKNDHIKSQVEELPENIASYGTASGTFTLGEHEYKLSHGLAYQLELNQQLLTTVLLTSEPVSLALLNEERKQHGNDYGFAPFVTQIRLRFDQTGQLLGVHLYADEFTVNTGGSEILSDCELSSTEAKGWVQTEQAGMFDGKPFEIQAQFEVFVHTDDEG